MTPIRLPLVLLALAAPMLASAAGLTLTGTVRDFLADGQNFEGAVVSGPGYVADTLTGPSPTLTSTGASVIEAGNFAQWFTKSTDTTSYSISLTETSPGSGTYQYSSDSFFPIDNQLLGNQGNGHNYHFTYALAATFGYLPGAGQVFTFEGDDDVWVFFDKKLGIDLGGVHAKQGATVLLDTLLAGHGAGNYALDFYFAERHTSASNLTITTSLQLQSVPEPEALVMTSVGLLALALARRRAR